MGVARLRPTYVYLVLILLTICVLATSSARREDTPAGATTHSTSVPVCGVVNPLARPSALKAHPKVIVTGGAVHGLAIAHGKLFVLDNSAHVVRVFTLEGEPINSIDLHGGMGMAVDPTGAIYTISTAAS